MLALALVLAARADERSAPAPIPLLVDPFIGDSPARVGGGADAAWQDDTSVGARASVEGAIASRVAARVSVGLPLAGEVESDLGGEARVLLTPHDSGIDAALGVRYKKIGFEGVDNEFEGFLALAHDAGKNRFVVNGVVGRGVEEGEVLEGTSDSGNGDEVTYEDAVESDAELGASWTLHVTEHAAIGALAQGRWSENHSDATLGPTIGVETGGLSAVALIGGTNVEEAGWGVRSAVIVQLAL
jgi:hypothetical protein